MNLRSRAAKAPAVTTICGFLGIGLVLFVIERGVSRASESQPGDEQAGDSELHALFRDVWQFRLREDPLWATFVGEHRYNNRLPRQSLADKLRRQSALKRFEKRLQGIDRKRLSRPDQIHYDIFRQNLANELAEHRYRTHLKPITNRSGFHVSFPQLPRRVPLSTVGDYENYIARLNGFSQYADDHIELMREGIRQRVVLPRVVLEGYEAVLKPHIVEQPEQSLLYGPFKRFPAHFSGEARSRLRAAGRRAIAKSVAPGYRKFLDFMRREYVPNARESVGASALPRGEDFYSQRVRRFTTLDYTPRQVHEIGKAEVARILAEMEKVIKRAGFEGARAEFIQHLRSEPKFYACTPKELLKQTAFVLKKMDGQLPRLFGRLPRTPYGIREVPAYIAPRTTTAYYQLPPGDGRRAGFYYVNTYDLKSRPLYEIEALSLHEAVPGHHLQLALQQELTHLPDFRRFSRITAFVEGWALYAERLGLEVGFYEDPYSDFGRLSYEMWRACRLVVDTGIHAFGWSRQQAIEYMARHTALSQHNIESEVDRYIAWPGQALAYKIGELKIRELRALAEKRLGDRFDIREFHDVILGEGAVPLPVLEENVRHYLAEKTGAAADKKDAAP